VGHGNIAISEGLNSLNEWPQDGVIKVLFF